MRASVCPHVGDRAPRCSRQTTLGMPEQLGTQTAVPGFRDSWHERRFDCALHRGLPRETQMALHTQTPPGAEGQSPGCAKMGGVLK